MDKLTIGQRQRVEIVKLLYRKADILIFDEPTALLTPQESDALFDVLRRLRDLGKSTIFITHKAPRGLSDRGPHDRDPAGAGSSAPPRRRRPAWRS